MINDLPELFKRNLDILVEVRCREDLIFDPMFEVTCFFHSLIACSKKRICRRIFTGPVQREVEPDPFQYADGGNLFEFRQVQADN